MKCVVAGQTDNSTLDLTNVTVGNVVTYGTAQFELIDPSASKIELWTTSKNYAVGDIVIRNDRLYRCVTAHTSTTFSANIANWVSLNSSIPQWQPNTDYFVGDVVQYNNTFYTCTNTHTSGTAFSTSDFDNLIDSSKGMTMDTLWTGIAGNLNGTSTDTITLSSSGTAYKKLGLFYDYWNGSRSCSGYTEVSVSALSSSFCFAPALKEINGYNPNFDKIQLTTDTTLYFESYYIQMTKVVGLVEGKYIPPTLEAVDVELYKGHFNTVGGTINLAYDITQYDRFLITVCHGNGTEMTTAEFMVADISIGTANNFMISGYLNNSSTYNVGFHFTSATTLVIDRIDLSAGWSQTATGIGRIVGVKYIQPNSYSTQEKMIGTWVDGKPLYRKVLLNPTTGSQFGLSNISVKRLTGVVHDTASPQFLFEMPYADGSYTIACNYNNTTDVVTINHTPANWGITPEYIFIDYTKN